MIVREQNKWLLLRHVASLHLVQLTNQCISSEKVHPSQYAKEFYAEDGQKWTPCPCRKAAGGHGTITDGKVVRPVLLVSTQVQRARKRATLTQIMFHKARIRHPGSKPPYFSLIECAISSHNGEWNLGKAAGSCAGTDIDIAGH